MPGWSKKDYRLQLTTGPAERSVSVKRGLDNSSHMQACKPQHQKVTDTGTCRTGPKPTNTCNLPYDQAGWSVYVKRDLEF